MCKQPSRTRNTDLELIQDIGYKYLMDFIKRKPHSTKNTTLMGRAIKLPRNKLNADIINGCDHFDTYLVGTERQQCGCNIVVI